MSAPKDGGPAFPVSTGNASEGHQDGHSTWQFPGMTLRDYFAAKAMQGMVAHDPESFARVGEVIGEAIARQAYSVADAMLDARGAQP